MRQPYPELISDRIRLALALLRCGYTASAAATKASVSEAELGFFRLIDENGDLPNEPPAPKRLH